MTIPQKFITETFEVANNLGPLELRAMEFATVRHYGQTYGATIYLSHLLEVKRMLSCFDLSFGQWMRDIEDADSRGIVDLSLKKEQKKQIEIIGLIHHVQSAAWLHDTLEDTETTREELIEKFGGDITDTVWRVTDEPGKNRRERWEATGPKIAESMPAIFVKLADRLANLRVSIVTQAPQLDMYKKEQDRFEELLFSKFNHEHVLAHKAINMMKMIREMVETKDVPIVLAEIWKARL